MMDRKISTQASLGVAFLLLAAIVLLQASAVQAVSTRASGGPGPVLDAVEKGARYVPGELVVRFNGAVSLGAQQELLQKKGFTVVKQLLLPGYSLVRFDGSRSVEEAAQSLAGSPLVISAEPNYLYHAQPARRSLPQLLPTLLRPNWFAPNDPLFPRQWHLDQIQMSAAWDLSKGAGVTVGVLDTGIAYENFGGFAQAPDLTGTAFAAGRDFVNNDDHANDDNGHGTHLAGTIAQTTNNGQGGAGVAFEATLMPVKVLNDVAEGTNQQIADGIVWATNHGAQVINLSLGGPAPSSALEGAVNYAYRHGVTVVAAAGNDATSPVLYPAAYPNAIAVGAVRFDETRAPYSNFGAALDLVAPGGDLAVDQNGDGQPDGILQDTLVDPSVDPTAFAFLYRQGTSMATAHVSGAAALLIAQGGVTTPDSVRNTLASTAKDLGALGFDIAFGHGLIQVRGALDAAPPPEPATKVAVEPVVQSVGLDRGPFDIVVTVSDVTDLSSFDFDLIYDPDILHVTGLTLGPFLGSSGRTIHPVGPVIDNTSGEIRFGATSSGSLPGATGSGQLARITLQPQSQGRTNLDLRNVQLTDTSGAAISLATETGHVAVLRCLVGDFDCDCDVDIMDLAAIAGHFGSSSSDPLYDPLYDMDSDGDIDLFDIVAVATRWGTTCEQRVVFISSRSDTRDKKVWVMDPDGTDAEVLTYGPSFTPAWSPDHTQIAFARQEGGITGDTEIVLMDASGGNERILTNNSASDVHPTWSPDGSQIAFASDRDGNWEIYVMEADGSNQQRLTLNPVSDTAPDWSPDGRSIAFSSNRGGTPDIWVMELAKRTVSNLTRSSVSDYEPAWSPDGRRIAFTRFVTSIDAEVYVMDFDGRNQVNLTNEPEEDQAPAWSPDGSEIVFMTSRRGNWEVFRMNADGTGQTNISGEPAFDGEPDW